LLLNLIESLFGGLANKCLKNAVSIVVVSAFAAAGALYYTVEHLGVNTDTGQLFSDDLDWRQTKIDYQAAFPVLSSNLLVVVDAPTPELVDDAAKRLGAALSAHTELLDWVYLPGTGEFFDRFGLLYLDADELQALSDNLVAVQPFIGTLAAEPTLSALFEISARAVEGSQAVDDDKLGRVLSRLTKTIGANLKGRSEPFSWREILLERPAKENERRRIIAVKPKLDFDQLLPTESVVQLIREQAASLRLTEENAIRVRITGELAMSHEELDSVSRGAAWAGLSALILVSIVLGVGLRSLWLVFASVLTLLVGLCFTAAFAALSIGHLNLISVAFAVLYIGLGIDFAVHLALRYRELVVGGCDTDTAIVRATTDVGGTLFLCALTTGIGFFAFVWTDFTGVSELGLISGTGMFISLIAAVVLLPALLTLKTAKLGNNVTVVEQSGKSPFQVVYRKPILMATAVLALGAIALLPSANFDRNSISVREAGSESVATFLELLADSETSPWPISMLSTYDAIGEVEQRVSHLDIVDSVVSVANFVPDNQQDKLWIIDELSLLLGLDAGVASEVTASEPAVLRAALQDLTHQIDERLANSTAPQFAAVLNELQTAVAGLLERLSEPDQASDALARLLERDLLSALVSEISKLNVSLDAESFGVDELPAEITRRWIAADGRYRVDILPTENIRDAQALRSFVDTVLPLVPSGTDSPVVMVRSGDVVVSSFQQAVTSAVVFVALLLLLVLRRVTDVVLVLVPLLLASCFTVAAMVLLDISFNFANVITLPLLLGIGVDNGIHMVRRAQNVDLNDRDILRTSTARAVIVSALTTIFSFGNLAFSAHPGTASMGQVLALGLTFNLICTLIVLPALLSHLAPAPALAPQH